MEVRERSCCLIGHRDVEEPEAIRARIRETVFRLTGEGITRFLLGSRGMFNRLCCEELAALRAEGVPLTRVYVRAEYPTVSEEYRAYLSTQFEESYYPPALLGAGRSVYLLRNRHMIDESAVCVIYLTAAAPPRSGTAQACAYARRRGKTVINLAERGE